MRLNGWHVPIEQLSASSLSLLITCPEQFRLRRIKKIPESFGPDKFIGTVDHETHAFNFEQKISTGIDLTSETMHRTYNDWWAHELGKEEPEWGETDPEAIKAHGLTMVDLYHEHVSPSVTPLRVEERFEYPITGVPVPVVGYIDIETAPAIIDRKTTKTKLSKPKVKWGFQAQIYSMVYDKPVDFHIVTKQATPQICLPDDTNELRVTPPNKDNMVRVITQAAVLLNDLWARYGPDSPWPTNGTFHDWACNYCGFGPRYGKQCVAWKETT